MANPKRFKNAKGLQTSVNKPNTWPTALTPPAPADIHTLPDVAGDDQRNVVSAEQQREGIPITIPLWPNPAEFPGDFDTLRVTIDGNEVYLDELEGPLTADVDIVLRSGRLRSHGPKEITYSVTLDGLPPGEFSLPQEVFVDAIDPNGNNRPSALQLPADLPSEGVTPAYLATHGGVTLTLPRPVDSRPGDTLAVFFGETDDMGKTITVPVTGAVTVMYTTVEIQAFGEGDFLITYQYIDRAGNATQVSIPRTLSVRTNNPPVLQPPLVPNAGVLIDKEEARQGVLVTVPSIVDFHPNDWVHIFAGGIEFGSQRLGVTPIFDLEFVADYSTLRAGGTLYNVHFKYEIRRGLDVFPSGETIVAVDLVEPGEPIIGPGPVDPTLALPVVRGDSAVDNSLIASDLDGTIRVTFPIYAGRTTLPSTEFIDVYYGTVGGEIAYTYELTGAEADGFMVSGTIQSAVVATYGNGNIPCWYVVRNANNYKESRKQEVSVNVFSLDGLADPVFTNLFTPPPPSTEAPFISCVQTPWVTVPIRIFDPVNLQDNDIVVIHAVRYLYNGATQPATPVAGSEQDSPPLGIGPSERLNGFTHNFALPYFDGDPTRRRGWLEVSWSISRNGPPPESGTSDAVSVKWDIRSSGETGTCAPTFLRNGSLG
ncbi:hypothetical protein [Pseudomonas sp. MUP55]|uniref:hypothetical protein n=1 Tax=Pseudomonas sp. MUP55 TaxID=3087234 RepID=UPI002A5AFDCB|nr:MULTISPECIES: hypothetical protein [unclassified Pseudomonas]WPN94159.1 hypothetical protein SC319_07225 [Pseudomonas sp. MUP56]WPN99686.1 hypothetical protein SC318_07225 [Pseudomonas sp. MUP55]